jgi:hypothetical protein
MERTGYAAVRGACAMRFFICVSPSGGPIPATIRSNADESWRVLRASVTEPDTLIDKGWTVHVVTIVVGEVAT